MTNLSTQLSAHPVFSCLQKSEIAALSRSAVARRYQKGEFLTLYGDIWPYLFLVAEGSVKAKKESGEGRTLVVATFMEGDLFWGVSFFHDDLPIPVTLEAGDPTRIYLWSRDQMLPYLSGNGCFSWELCRLMVSRMLTASEIVENLAFQPVAGRLARLMVELVGEDGHGPISRNLTLDEMAARIGSTREMVCRFLHRFADEGLIDITRTEFLVNNRPGLEKLAEKGKN